MALGFGAPGGVKIAFSADSQAVSQSLGPENTIKLSKLGQVARNLSDPEEGFLTGKRYLIHDRDPLFTTEFLEILKSTGVQSVKLPPHSPNLNAHAERFVRTIKESCLERMILFGEGSLRKAIHEFVEPYHRERNHQGLDNRLIIQEQLVADRAAAIQRRSRWGGMLNYY